MKTKVIETGDSEIPQYIKDQIKESLEIKGFYIIEIISKEMIISSMQSSYLKSLQWFFSGIFLIFFLNLISEDLNFYIPFSITLLSVGIFGLLHIIYSTLKLSFKMINYLNSKDILITKRGVLNGGHIFIGEGKDFYINTINKAKKESEKNIKTINIEKEIQRLFSGNWEQAFAGIILIIIFYFSFPLFWLISTILGKLGFLAYKIKNKDLVFLDSSEKQIQKISQSIKSKSDILKEAFKNGKYNSVEKSFEKLGELTQKSNEIGIQINEKFKNFEKVKDIFDLSMFQDWIKKEMYSPFLELEKVLSKSLEENIKTSKDLQVLIENENNLTLKNPLILQKERLNIQKEELEKYKNLIQSYLLKLQ